MRDAAHRLRIRPDVAGVGMYPTAVAVLRDHHHFLQWDGTFAAPDGHLVPTGHTEWASGGGELVPVPSLSRLTADCDYGPFGFAHTPLFLDQPEHTRFRRLITEDWELSSALRRAGPQTAAVAEDLLDQGRAAGTVEFMRSVAARLSATVLAMVFGGASQLWIDVTLGLVWGGPSAGDRGARLAADFQHHMWELVRSPTSSPGDDAISRMAQHGLSGDGLRRNEILAIAFETAFVPNESTIRLLGALARTLASSGDLRAQLRGDPAGTVAFVGEVLRSNPPIRGLFRRTERPRTADGVAFPGHSGVFVDLKHASRGDHGRANRAHDHLAFGLGVHRCPGARLAVMVASAMTQALCRLPSLRIADGGLKNVPDGFLEGPSELWLEL